MKATLNFDLDDIDDQRRFEQCNNATKMSIMIFEFDQYLRGKIKHNDTNLTGDAIDALEDAREMLYHIANKYSLNMDDL